MKELQKHMKSYTVRRRL